MTGSGAHPHTTAAPHPCTLWLPRCALREMMREADHRAPLETGGVLLGYWAAAQDAAVVEHIVGPGPRAARRRTDFAPDHAYQEREIAQLYRKAGGNLEYLGDWHTHPGGPAALSGKDVATLRRIARYSAARAPRPIMLLLAGGTPWRPAAWVGTLTKRRWWRETLAVSPLSLEVDETPPGTARGSTPR